MKLNGWQRLWVILTVPWLAFVMYRAFLWVVVNDRGLVNEAGGHMLLSLIAPFGVYVLVLVARRLALWVVDGFRGD